MASNFNLESFTFNFIYVTLAVQEPLTAFCLMQAFHALLGIQVSFVLYFPGFCCKLLVPRIIAGLVVRGRHGQSISPAQAPPSTLSAADGCLLGAVAPGGPALGAGTAQLSP